MYLLAVLALITPFQQASKGAFTIAAVKTDTPPAIDGTVGSAEWSRGAAAGNFIQYEPQRGASSEVSSEARILYDDAYLYVSFRLREPTTVTAQLTRRDAELLSDDSVVLILDSYFDRRSGYYFMTNALGTQADGRIANDGRTMDKTWDAPWQSAGRLTDDGWEAEMAVPFTSLQYSGGESQTWGINFGRSRRRTLELSFWAGPLDHQARVSQAGDLVGISVPPPVRRWQVIPYGLSKLQEGERTNLETGADFRYALTPEISLNATLFPDFATIEADQEQINLTRFELSLPEKRPFFLEGAELFRQRIRTFYSRRIPDIQGGAQMNGKSGPWSMAFVGVRSEPLADSTSAAYGIARVQRDVFGSSNVALMLANRTHEGKQMGSLEMDATLFFTSTLGMTAQLVQSWGTPGSSTWAYFLRPSYDSSTSHFHVRYTHLGRHFAENVNAVGFVRDDDRRELDSALEHTFWMKNRTFERIQYDSNYNVYWSQSGLLRSWQIDEGIEIELRNRFSLSLSRSEEFKRYEKDFRNRQTAVELAYNARAFQSIRAELEFGRNYDSDYRLFSATASYKLTQELSLEYALERLYLDPDPENESTWIHVVRFDQFFTKDLYVRLFFQTNTSIDRKNIQAVFVYRYRPPFGAVQLAFQRGTAAFGERSGQGNTLFLKLSTVL